MVRSYDRYELEQVFGIVASIQSNSIYTQGLAVVPALERVIIWDVKKGTKVWSWFDRECTAEVTQIARSPSGDVFAVGYSDGAIRFWSLQLEDSIVTLNGHRSAVTALAFDASGTRLASGSRDTHVVLWDVVAEVGISRLKGHRNQITGIRFLGENLITTSKDSYLKVWDTTTSHCVETHTAHRGECWALAISPDEKFAVTGGEGELKIWTIDSTAEKQFTVQTTFERPSKCSLEFSPDGQYLAQRTDKAIEIFRMWSEKRRKRKKPDKVVSHLTIRTRSQSISWGDALLATSNNSLAVYKSDEDYSTPYSLDLPGHQTDIRAACLSSTSEVLATGSDGSLKVWNINSGACIRTYECGYILCMTFILEDKFIVAGTKEGLEVYEVASSSLVEKLSSGNIWSLQVHPDGKSIATGSEKSVKIFKFDTIDVDIIGSKRKTQQLTLKHSRTLKLTDDVLAVRYSPDAKLLAVALLDSTVRIFFADTLKFFLNLYGHKLPVLNMDISADSKMLATCSADKNVKLWGLDFGDCHKSIFAHNDAILQVQFERKGHNFFTSSRDKMIKFWDGDRFENILRLGGHHAEVSAIAVGANFLVSAGHDKSIRVWRQVDDPVFLEEEREKELEEIYENQLADSLNRTELDDKEAGRAGQTTTETLMAGEKLMEALDIGESDRIMRESNMTNPLLNALNVSAERHVLNVCSKIIASHLEDALLVLPFDKVILLFKFLDVWAKNAWAIPLTTRVLVFLIRTHHSQIIANQLMRVMLDSIRGHLRTALQQQKDLMGYNIAALTFIRREFTATTQKDFQEAEEVRPKRAFATI